MACFLCIFLINVTLVDEELKEGRTGYESCRFHNVLFLGALVLEVTAESIIRSADMGPNSLQEEKDLQG